MCRRSPRAPSSFNRAITPALDALVARALKKNPNERFPSAAAMRDECARVLPAAQTGAPVIVQGAPQNSSGSGVGSAVFPPVDQSMGTSTPPPQSVQSPYQPGPYGPPTPAHMQTPAPGYGYPQASQGYQTPTPSPYTIPQQPMAGSGHGGPVSHGGTNGAGTGMGNGAGTGGNGGGKRNTPVIVGSIAVAVVAIAGLVTVLTMNGGAKGGGEAGPSGSTTVAADHRGPERNRTIEASECSEASDDATDPSRVTAPDLRYKDILSVKDCLRAAGWTWSEPKKQNDGSQAEDIVIDQYPRPGAAVLPKEQEFELTLSTGDAG